MAKKVKQTPCPFWRKPWYIWEGLPWWEKALSRLWGWAHPGRRCQSCRCWWSEIESLSYAKGYHACYDGGRWAGPTRADEGCRRWQGHTNSQRRAR